MLEPVLLASKHKFLKAGFLAYILNVSVLIVNSSFFSNKTKVNSVEENQTGGNKNETLQNDATLLDV